MPSHTAAERRKKKIPNKATGRIRGPSKKKIPNKATGKIRGPSKKKIPNKVKLKRRP